MDVRAVLTVLCVLELWDVTSVLAGAASNCPQLKLKNGRARVRGRRRMVNFRCLKGFTRVGPKFAVCLKQGQWSQQPPICVKGQGCPKLPNDPHLQIFKLYKGGVLRFSCASGLLRSGPEEIWCNGQSWSDPPPRCLEGMSMGCDFEEEGNCGWNHDADGNFEWTRTSGKTPTTNTGPQVDHTTNSSGGHYLFVESSAPQAAGHKARLISPPYKPDKVMGLCLEFWYHMFGPPEEGLGELDVFLKPVDTLTMALRPEHSVFHVAGNQDDVWHHADIDIPEQDWSFEIVFQGTRLKSWESDIAIDDIRLYNCSTRPETTLLTTTTTMVTRPTTLPMTTLDFDDFRTDQFTSDMMTTKISRMTSVEMPATARKKPSTQTTKKTSERMPLTSSTTTPPPTTTTTPGSTLIKTTTTTTTTTTTPTPTSPTTPRSTTTAKQSPASETTKARTPRRQEPKTTQQTGDDVKTDSDDVTSMVVKDKTTTLIPDTTMDNKITQKRPNTIIIQYTEREHGGKGTANTTPTELPVMETSVVTHQENTDSSNDTSGGNPSSGTAREGAVKDGGQSSSASSMGELLPMIIGVVAAVLVGAVVISLLAWTWAKNQRRKEEKEQEDQMNIITEYVETNLTI